jgi:hypothetical protein
MKAHGRRKSNGKKATVSRHKTNISMETNKTSHLPLQTINKSIFSLKAAILV